jgi:hypothetical protein
MLLRLAPLVGVGVAAGFSSRRISSDALELQATSALQQALLDSTVDGICLTDVAGRSCSRTRRSSASASSSACRHTAL